VQCARRLGRGRLLGWAGRNALLAGFVGRRLGKAILDSGGLDGPSGREDR